MSKCCSALFEKAGDQAHRTKGQLVAFDDRGARAMLGELEALDPAAERFDAKATVLIESVRHHVKEEEGELFPKVRAKIARRELVDLGAELRDAKRQAPTHPHPSSARHAPGNVLVGGAVAVMDKARDVGKRTVDRVRDEIPAL